MTFREILGQSRAVTQLRTAWRTGRLPQAYCFLGPPGVGKRTTALALAQAVNCAAPVGAEGDSAAADACGECVPCRKIAGGSHPDVRRVQPEGKTVITIDQVREVAAQAALRAYEGRTKVWIVDPADLMQEPAANAFLKTLEEPAAGSLFVLVTTLPTGLLPTIRSRCQWVQFDPLGEPNLRELLRRGGRTPEAAAAIAALAGGSAERAHGLDLAEVRELRDRIPREVWGSLDPLPALLGRAEQLARERASFESALEMLAAFSRDMALAKIGGDVGALVHADRRMEAERMSAVHPMGAILEAYQAQAEAQTALGRYANPRLTAERMLLRMRRAIGLGQEMSHGERGPH